MAPLPPTRERPTVFLPPASGQPASPLGAPGTSPPRRRRWLRIVGFTAAILFAVVLGAAASVAFFAKHEVDQLFVTQDKQVLAAQRKLVKPLPGKPANILILGSDHRSGNASTDKRSDTILLMRLDPKGKTISMLSFPRDLYVPIPGHGSSKINDAYSIGGPALSVDTIKQLTGVDVNFIVNVDFAGFRGIVDTLGGVYVDVDREYKHESTPGAGNYASINLSPGYQLLNGRQALSYARYRHTDSDFYRIARQQAVMSQIKKQIGASSVASNIQGLFGVLNKNTDMAVGGSNGKIDAGVVIDYLRLALALKPHSVYQNEVQGGIGVGPGGASIVEASTEDINKQVKAFLHPNADAQNETADQIGSDAAKTTASTGTTATEAAKPALPAPSAVTITVLNGNGIGGAAARAAAGLRTLGYPTTVPAGTAGSADNPNYANTRVVYTKTSDEALAESVAELFPGASTERSTGSNPFTTRLLVIVGKTGATPENGTAGGDTTTDTASSTVGSAENNTVPTKAKPTVVPDPYAAQLFRPARGQVKMPILYPSVREVGSSYDDGIYVYKIPKGRKAYDAYRMVASTGNGDYWGFQATTWANPPILSDPTRTVVRGNRTYSLFFNGTKLHIVSWRQANGTYYVINTLLDKLSNTTMMALAESAKPLGRA